MAKIIAVANQKGGVGKTTTTLNIGAALAKQGKRVLLVDLDPQANLSTCLGWIPDNLPTVSELMNSIVSGQEISLVGSIRQNLAENLDYIPSTLALSAAEFFLVTAFSRETVLRRILFLPEAQAYDYILIDCLPSLGILFVNALSAADRLLIPVQAQKLALDGMQLVLNAYRQVQTNINPSLQLAGILVTMADNTNMARSVIDILRGQYGELVYADCISKSVQASNSTYAQKSLVTMREKLGLQYEAVTAELLQREGEKK